MTKDDMPYGYVIDDRIRNKYHAGFNRQDDIITHFIVHGTAGGQTAESNLKWMLSGGAVPDGTTRENQYRRGVCLFHAIIDRDGKIIEIINPHKFVYHSSSGTFDSHTIGVELTNPDRTNGGSYTDMQYKALAKYYLWLSEIFVNMKTIEGHGAIKQEKTGTYKFCPGAFSFNKLNIMLVDNFKHTIYRQGTEKIEVL